MASARLEGWRDKAFVLPSPQLLAVSVPLRTRGAGGVKLLSWAVLLEQTGNANHARWRFPSGDGAGGAMSLPGPTPREQGTGRAPARRAGLDRDTERGR